MLILPLFVLASCSGSAPLIEDMRWRVVYRDDGNYRYEELRLYVLPSDPDGYEDLASIRLLSEDTDLYWYADRSVWVSGGNQNNSWVGLPALVMNDSPSLPDVLYTVRLEDLAGRSDERTFRLDALRPSLRDVVWPRASVEGGTFMLESPYKTGTLYLRDAGLKVLDFFPVSDGQAISNKEAVSWEIWIPLEEQSRGILLGPIEFDTAEL